MTPLFRKFLAINWVLFATIVGLLTFGVTAVYSASSFRPEPGLANAWYRQVIWIAVGVVVFFGTALINYKWIRWGAPLVYLAGIAGLFLVRAKGDVRSGAQSWLEVGSITVQPSQVAILGGILALAVILADLKHIHQLFRYHSVRLLLCLFVVAVPMGRVLMEPDVGSASVWGPVLAAMLLVGGIRYRYLLALLLITLTIMPQVYFFVLKPYQKARIETHVRMMQGKKVDLHCVCP